MHIRKAIPLLLALWAPSAPAAIVLATLGTPVVETFDTLPAASEFSTLAALDSAGGAGAATSAAALDLAINANANVSAATLITQLGSSATWPTSQANLGRYNSGVNVGGGYNGGGFLQFRPTGTAYAVTMATLLNSTGGPILELSISYNYFAGAVMTGDEDVDGLRAYYSASGNAGSWVNIPNLSADTTVTTGTVAAPELLAASLNLSGTPWADGTPLYLLWADDNSALPADAGGTAAVAGNERSYHIDNLSLTGSAVPEPGALTLLVPMLGFLILSRKRK